MRVDLRDKAVILRKEGKSIKQIALLLHVSQSSASRWCTGINLTRNQQNLLDDKRRKAGLKALAPWIRKLQMKKVNDIKYQSALGKNDIGNMTKRDLYVLGLGLYWGEGYKKGSQELGFTNTDPDLIVVFILWLEDIFDVKRHDLIARITINARYISETKRIQKEWSKFTGIPQTQFTKPSYINTNSLYPLKNPRTYRGTLRIKVRNGTSLRRRILASIKESSDQISLNSRNTFS